MIKTYVVLDPITPPAQRIVLQVQDLEPGVHVFHEIADLQWPREISQGHRVDGQAGQLVR